MNAATLAARPATGGDLASVLGSYRSVLVLKQRRVTGDPGALLVRARAHRDGAERAGEVGRALERARTGMVPAWTGTAHDRFRAAALRLGTEVTALVTALRSQAAALDRAAGALRTARTRLDAILRHFDDRAIQFVTLAQAIGSSPAAPQIQADLLTRARQFGEESVAGAGEAERQLAEVLEQVTAELRQAATTVPASTPR